MTTINPNIFSEKVQHAGEQFNCVRGSFVSDYKNFFRLPADTERRKVSAHIIIYAILLLMTGFLSGLLYVEIEKRNLQKNSAPQAHIEDATVSWHGQYERIEGATVSWHGQYERIEDAAVSWHGQYERIEGQINSEYPIEYHI